MENREMNFFDLCVAFARWLKRALIKCWHYFLVSFRLFCRRWYVSVVVMAVFIGLGLWYSRPDNRIYKVESVLYLNGPRTENVTQFSARLQKAVRAEVLESQTMPVMLGLDNEQAATLCSFKTFPVIDYRHDGTADVVDYKRKHKLSDTVDVVMDNCICLQFRTKRPQYAALVGEAIVNYMNRQESAQSAYEAYLNIIKSESAFYHSQMRQLDSIAAAYYYADMSSQQMVREHEYSQVMIGRREMRMLTPEMKKLVAQAQMVDYKLSRATAPVVSETGFVVSPKPDNTLAKSLLCALLLGYIADVLLLYIVSRWKEFVAWVKK